MPPSFPRSPSGSGLPGEKDGKVTPDSPQTLTILSQLKASCKQEFRAATDKWTTLLRSCLSQPRQGAEPSCRHTGSHKNLTPSLPRIKSLSSKYGIKYGLWGPALSTCLWKRSGRRMKTSLSVTLIVKGYSEHQDAMIQTSLYDSFLPFHPLSKIAPQSYFHLNGAA